MILADYTALIEPLSLDEAYLDVTENLRGVSTASATATEIRARIFDESGLTASAGISYNKFLAKLASDHHKPNGQFVVTPAMGAAFVENLPIVTSQESLRNVSIGLVRTVFPPSNGVRLLGVTLSSFESADRGVSEQLDLGLVGP